MSKKINTICHLCNQIMKDEIPPKTCTRCEADLTNPQSERIIKQTHCQFSLAKNKPGDYGYLYLTNKRLLCVNSASSTGYGGGLIGAAIAASAVKKRWGFSLPLEDVSSFEESKFGLFVKAFTVTAKDGSEYKLSAKPKEEWIEAITAVKEQPDNVNPASAPPPNYNANNINTQGGLTMNTEKNTSIGGALLLFLVTAAAGSLLSFLYLWVNRINPYVYLSVISAAAFGLVIGLIATKLTKVLKIEKAAPAVAAVIVGCLCFTYVKWAIYVSNDREMTFDSYGRDFNSFMEWYNDLEYDFTDEDNAPYADMTAVIERMQRTSVYEYIGGAEAWASWNLSEEDVEYLMGISYYEYIEYDVYLGRTASQAAHYLDSFFASSDYAYYTDYRDNRHNDPDTFYYIKKPNRMVDTIIRINSEGRWTYSNNSSGSGNDDRAMEVNGMLLWLVWAIELLVICGYSVYGTAKGVRELNVSPPPQFNNEWADREFPKTEAPGVVPESEEVQEEKETIV